MQNCIVCFKSSRSPHFHLNQRDREQVTLVRHCVFVWSNIQVGILQYGEVALHEWSLKDYQTTQEVVEAAKNISRQEGRETRTAYAIHKAW